MLDLGGYAKGYALDRAAKILRDEGVKAALINVGGKEQDVPTRVPNGVALELPELQGIVAMARMVDGATEFADKLRELGLSSVECVVFKDEEHGSVVPAAISRALSFSLPDPV